MSLIGATPARRVTNNRKQRRRAAAGDSSPSATSSAAWDESSRVDHDDRIRAGVAHQWREFFREWDVVLCPGCRRPPIPHDHSDPNNQEIQVEWKQIHMEIRAVSSVATQTDAGDCDAIAPVMKVCRLHANYRAYLEDRTR